MFDFGNVIGLIDYAPMFERLASRLGVEAWSLEQTLELKAAGSLGREFETGRIGPEAFASGVLAACGHELPYEEFRAAWPGIFRLNEPVASLAAELKRRGYTLLLGSNTSVLHAEFFLREFRDALKSFDYFIFSYELGTMKPSPEFFAACVGAAGVPAADCVFIDDAPANVAGAIRAGLVGVLYRDPEGLAAELRRLGIEVPTPQA